MPNYDQFKKAWNSMWNAERKKYTEQYKNDAQFQQFANQYSQEMKNTGSQWNVNQNLDTNTNQWTNTQQWVVNNQNQTNANETNWQNQTNFSEQKKPDVDKSVVAENFDQSRLTNDNAQVSVKEWTAAQTWMPDYEADSDARDNEIVNNLNAYINSNPEFFSDRATFNQNFHYSERNQRQKTLLDSFWKGQEDRKKASTYATGDSISEGMKNWDITPDQMNYIKSMNPDAYREWQEKQQENVDKMIANMSVPSNPTDTAELFSQLVEKLGLQPWDPYKIYENWYGMCEQLGVFRDSQQLATLSNNIAGIYATMNNNVQSISSQLEWRYSAWYIAAKINKENSALNAQAANMQTSYNLLLQNRQQNLAIANQSATALQMQGQEDSRIFNQKLAWLGFAMQADSYRTPEQQAQLQLQTAQIQNDLNLLNQSKLNDLSLYNQKQLNDLNLQYQADLFRQQNQLQNELTDLSVSDENQLRANLNNVLSQYYAQWWDIIKRPQAQALDDILAYAKEKWISVAQALKENFVEPLQSKTEYKNVIASKFAAPVKSWVTVNSDWSIDFWVTTEWWLTYTPITSTQLYWWFRDFVDSKKVWDKWWQCWKFVNDYLQSMWFNRIYKDSVSSKLNSINTDKNDLDNLSVWSVAVFDYAWVNWVSENSKKYGHVAIVTEIDKANNRVKVIESNNKWDEKISTRWVSLNGNALKWFFDPSKWSDTQSANPNLAKDINAQALLKQIETWQITDTKISEAREELVAKWYGQEFMNALNRWFKVNLNEAQNKMLDTTLNRFNSNQIVKDFESAGNQVWNLIEALNANNWVWDTAAIFTFMKVLDPSSVVRESEFENAASTAWYTNPKALWQKYVSHGWDGTWLTDAQRGNFKEFAKSLIKSQSKMYQQKYDDAIRYLNNANIDEMWYPTNYADLIIKSLEDSWSSKVSFNSNTKNNINWYEQYTSWGNNNQVYSDWLPNNFYSFWS